MAGSVIRIAAALLKDERGWVFLVRKRQTDAFMQPGGKIEASEQPIDALIRELREELGLVIPPDAAHPLGCFTAPAAFEPGSLVEAELFDVSSNQTPQPSAEIAEGAWVDPENPGALKLAQLTRDHVLPLALKRRARTAR